MTLSTNSKLIQSILLVFLFQLCILGKAWAYNAPEVEYQKAPELYSKITELIEQHKNRILLLEITIDQMENSGQDDQFQQQKEIFLDEQEVLLNAFSEYVAEVNPLINYFIKTNPVKSFSYTRLSENSTIFFSSSNTVISYRSAYNHLRDRMDALLPVAMKLAKKSASLGSSNQERAAFAREINDCASKMTGLLEEVVFTANEILTLLMEDSHRI